MKPTPNSGYLFEWNERMMHEFQGRNQSPESHVVTSARFQTVVLQRCRDAGKL